MKERLPGLNRQHIFSYKARKKVISLAENDKLTEQVSSTEDNMKNLYVSDASDSHAYIYKADGQFQFVKEFEFSAAERSASSGCRELLYRSLYKLTQSSSENTGEGQFIGRRTPRIVMDFL